MYNNPYYNPMQTYIPRYPNVDGTQQPIQPMNTTNYVPPVQNTSTQPALLGKLVDSIDVVKSMEYPLDGSTSYYPLTDGSAILTKKLLQNGTSEMKIYKQVEEESKEVPKYVTMDDLKETIKGIDPSKMIKKLEEKLDELKDDFKDFKKSKKKED